MISKMVTFYISHMSLYKETTCRHYSRKWDDLSATDISNLDYYKNSYPEISKVYNIGLQRYEDLKIRVFFVGLKYNVLEHV